MVRQLRGAMAEPAWRSLVTRLRAGSPGFEVRPELRMSNTDERLSRL